VKYLDFRSEERRPKSERFMEAILLAQRQVLFPQKPLSP